MPILAVVAVVLLVFIMLLTFSSGDKEFKIPTWLKVTLGILIGVTLIISLLVLTGYWDKLVAYVTGSGTGTSANIFFIIVIIVAIVVVLTTSKSSSSSS